VRRRPRELGIVIGNLPTGRHNAITDVPGVRVGHKTLIKGQGKLVPGKGPIRTGVTVVLPPGEDWFDRKLVASAHVINGFGKSIGLPQVDELGQLETLIALTNTLNVGIVADALIEHMLGLNPEIGITTGTVNPVVGECNDGFLNDIQGRHVARAHVFEAIAVASGGAVAEGAVGAGTGMSCFGFKGGIGTASRWLPEAVGGYVLGCLVLANYGRPEQLLVSGVPVGRLLKERDQQLAAGSEPEKGSVMVVLTTSAPLTSRQLGRVARRAAYGLARTGSIAGHGSGDFVLAFTTENRTESDSGTRQLQALPETGRQGSVVFDFMFQATVEATEEAVLNALFTAETVVGRDGNTRHALPVERVLRLVGKRR